MFKIYYNLTTGTLQILIFDFILSMILFSTFTIASYQKNISLIINPKITTYITIKESL
jgi:hypothetical protein